MGKKNENFVLKVSTARSKSMRNFVCSVDPSMIVTCGYDVFEDAVKEYLTGIKLTDKLLSSCNWVIAQVIKSIDTGASEFFNDLCNMVLSKNITNDNTEIFNKLVMDTADQLGETHKGLFDPNDHFVNFHKTAVYIIASLVIMNAMSINPDDVLIYSAASSSSNSTSTKPDSVVEYEKVDVDKLNSFIDTTTSNICKELVQVLGKSGIAINQIPNQSTVKSDVVQLVKDSFNVKDINTLSNNELISKVSLSVSMLINRYISDAVRLHTKPVTALTAASISKPSTYMIVVEVINKLFKNEGFITVSNMSDDELDMIRKAILSKINKDVTVDDIEAVYSDDKLMEQFIIDAFSELPLRVFNKFNMIGNNTTIINKIVETEIRKIFGSDTETTVQCVKPKSEADERRERSLRLLREAAKASAPHYMAAMNILEARKGKGA